MMKDTYKTPNDWYNANRNQLRQYKGEWIVVTNQGVIAHHKDYLKATEILKNLSSPYFLDRIFESDFVEPIRLIPIRFRQVKRHEWQPK
jgi:hypothetical protein